VTNEMIPKHEHNVDIVHESGPGLMTVIKWRFFHSGSPCLLLLRCRCLWGTLKERGVMVWLAWHDSGLLRNN
jgi:hypothetical protein